MSPDELLDHIDVTLSKAADGPPDGPRPQGTFVGNPPRRAISGLRIVAPDGTVLYVAAFAAGQFESRRPVKV